jgi:hypothetical protein
MTDSTSVGMYQCLCCYGPSEGPWSCSLCLAAGPHAHPAPGVFAPAPFPAPVPQPKVKKRVKVEPEEGGELEQFLIANTAAASAAKEAGESAEEWKLAVKTWLLSLFPPLADGTPNPDMPDAFDVTADPHGRYPGYTMTLKEGHHLDADRMRLDGVYDSIHGAYDVPNKPSWELRPDAQGRKPR